MDDEYDVVVLGTGLKESILSGLMSSVAKKKVLHMDRNPYYGGESASLNLEQLYKKFRNGDKPPEELGQSRQYCVDLCPKFLMACGDLVKVLLQTQVTSYLEFQSVAGSFVFKDSKIHQVPSTPAQAATSSLMGIFQKRRFKNFVQWVNNYEESDAKTHSGCDLKTMTSAKCFDYWKLEESTKLFTGHAVALYQDDSYLQRPALEMVERCKLYAYSVSRYGNSPYIYPKWGLGMLPEGFSRRCAVFGGVYMLNVEEKKDFAEKVVFNEEGKACGVQSEGKVAKCTQVIADPSYFIGTDQIQADGQVARCICILSHPIDGTNNADGCQIIFPAPSIGRKNDIYVSMVSYVHEVAPRGKYVAVVSTKVETKDPETELAVAMKFLGKVDEKFFWVTDCFKPVNDPAKDNCFITSSYDATTHFTTATAEVLRMYKALTGTEVDLSGSAEPEDLQP
jgi:Rab GDP dissociation inhibitor